MVNKIIHGNCLDKLKELPENSVDSIVTDPPYHLVSIVKRFGGENSRNTPAMNTKEGGVFARKAKGFMGKEWDGVDENGMGIANNPVMWAECLRVLKPGGHLLAFSGTRTYHRMAVAIEDAGFEVRDMIEWVYGSGFPKSLNIGKAVDKLQGVEHPKNTVISENGSMSGANYTRNKMDVQSDLAKQWEGWGTALKPAHEPICMARKPLVEKTVAENCLKYGTGGINIDGSRVENIGKSTLRPLGKSAYQKGGGIVNGGVAGTHEVESEFGGGHEGGRFPANLIHDTSEEVRECFPNESERFFKSIIYQAKASKSERNKGCEELEDSIGGGMNGTENQTLLTGSGNIRNNITKNNHPTVKPIALMEYLIKMVTPKGGIVLDPFAGSGSTLVAAKQNDYQYIGIEMTEEYIPIIEARLK